MGATIHGVVERRQKTKEKHTRQPLHNCIDDKEHVNQRHFEDRVSEPGQVNAIP